MIATIFHARFATIRSSFQYYDHICAVGHGRVEGSWTVKGIMRGEC